MCLTGDSTVDIMPEMYVWMALKDANIDNENYFSGLRSLSQMADSLMKNPTPFARLSR